MLGILRIGFKLLVNDKAKFAALLIGITFAVFLMIEMTSLFSGILSRASATVVNTGVKIWVMDPAVQTVANSIPLPDYVLAQARSIPGVKYAVPIYSGSGLVKLKSGTYQAVNVVGLDDTSLLGRPEMIEGNIEDIFAENGFVAIRDSAYVYGRRPAAQPPAFKPAANPYPDGVYANGILESHQSHGANVNIYPEVSGPITSILVAEGEVVHKGDSLLTIEDTVQRQTTGQQRMQAEVALSTLQELKAQPRPETLEVSKAQVEYANATLKTAQDNLARVEQAYKVASGTVSLQQVDDVRHAAKVAETNLAVAQKQFELTRAGAWSYDIKNQENQYAALYQAYKASNALLDKYTVRAPVDGVLLSIGVSAGSYVSPQGAYDTYTGGQCPPIVMGTPQDVMDVRCYVDEILVHRLPVPEKMTATMSIRGTQVKVPLTFERLQPYVSPKIELADQRQERVDVRVLPVIFRFDKPRGLNLFPGQLVDVFIAQKSNR